MNNGSRSGALVGLILSLFPLIGFGTFGAIALTYGIAGQNQNGGWWQVIVIGLVFLSIAAAFAYSVYQFSKDLVAEPQATVE